MTQPEDFFFSSDAPLGGVGDVRVTWLGTAGFAVEHDGHVLLLDPYLTRALPAMRFAALVDRLDTAAPRLPVGALPLLGALRL
jgi:L-ascorbate metabolism protein UlaG (beta-lactamase superfamily)